MKDGELVGIIKFFKAPEKLQALERGLFYCNTPEYYRHSGDAGISDLHESCNHAYRKSRGDKPVKLYLGDHELEGLTALTVHNGRIKDKWLHCWFALPIPSDESELNSLVADIDLMREKFGTEYAFVQANHIKELARRIATVTDHAVNHGNVGYSNDRMDWSVCCKSQKYRYQREYRFVLGECKHDCIEPLILRYEDGFADILRKNCSLEIMDESTGHVWFHLDANNCYRDTT